QDPRLPGPHPGAGRGAAQPAQRRRRRRAVLRDHRCGQAAAAHLPAHVGRARPHPRLTMARRRLLRTTGLATGVGELVFADPSGAELPAWEPGAHRTLHLPNGMAREYARCGDPADRRRYTVAVQRDQASRGGSAWVHDRLRVGGFLEVDGPRNTFALEDAPAYGLIAGGIGITPIAAMAEARHARGAAWWLRDCGRSRASLAGGDR